jgi:NADH-quinone oxidoreductase subunit E
MPASAAAAGRPPGLASPPGEPDDLKLIKGVGPAFEHKLNQLGIYCYRQIAAWTPAQRDWIGQELGAARIEKDRWIEQAAALAIGNKPPGDNGN